MLHYDVVVIGSGPAGERGAIQAASLGKKVAVVEKETVPGGACANTGTIPSKALRETAGALLRARSRDAHGVEVRISRKVTIPELMGRRGLVTAREHARIRNALSQAGVEMFRGTASFLDPHRIQVAIADGSTQELEAGAVLLATGTRPFHPPTIPFDHAHIYDSDSILLLDQIPRTLAVLGGGVAGCEYASIFAALGVHVTLVDSKARILHFLDAEISRTLQDIMMAGGAEFHQNVRVAGVEPGDRDVLVTLSDGSRLVAEKVLVASGRIGNVESLNLPAAGLSANERGLMQVDAHCQTAVPHIYAAGDVIGFPGLAATAMEQGRIAMAHACGQGHAAPPAGLLPMGIYTIPEVSSVGETEEALQQRSIPYVAGRARFSENARANLVGQAVGFLKLLVSADDERILGVHCIGPRASELVHVGAAVMALGGTVQYFADAVFNYPTVGEAYKYAAYEALDGLKERKVKRLERIEKVSQG